MDFLPALCRADPVHRKQLSLVVTGEWRDRVVSESKNPKTEVKSGFSIANKNPKSSSQSSSWSCSELCKDLELGMGLAGHRLWPEKHLSGAGGFLLQGLS